MVRFALFLVAALLIVTGTGYALGTGPAFIMAGLIILWAMKKP